MDSEIAPHIAWIVLGFSLMIAELLTGTFYLLVLGAAAFAAAIAAWLGLPFPVQAIIGGVGAGVGIYLVHAYRVKNLQQQMAPVDLGQPATFEAWIDEPNGVARVRYRDAAWEAVVEGERVLSPGGLLYVTATHGNTLHVSRVRPG